MGDAQVGLKDPNCSNFLSTSLRIRFNLNKQQCFILFFVLLLVALEVVEDNGSCIIGVIEVERSG